MKNILLFAICLLINFVASAQVDSSSTEDVKMYGTVKEKQHQENLESQFGAGRAVFIGYTRFYENQLSTYIQSELKYSLDDTKDVPNIDKYHFTKNGVYIGKQKPEKLFLNFTFDKADRVSSGKITGNLTDLINLFLFYWPSSHQWQNQDQLKKGVVATKHFWGDLITFTYPATGACITITKDTAVAFNPNQ